MEYTGDGRDYKDITLTIANEDKKQQVVLIVVRAEGEKDDHGKYQSVGDEIALAITSSNVQPLSINDRHFGTVKNIEGKFKIYEVMVPASDKENYVVEVETCEGSTEIYIADTFADLMENKFESRNSKTDYGKIYATLRAPEVGKKKYIVALRSNNNRQGFDELPYADFKIEARSFPTALTKGGDYMERYYIPDSGNLEFSFVDDMEWL